MMKKAVVVLCVAVVLLAVFGGIVTAKLAKTQDTMARRYFDEWYSLYRMTEMGTLSGEEVLLLVNHQGHYGLANWSADDTEEVRMLLQDYEILLRLMGDTEDPQLAEEGRALLAELNEEIRAVCGKVLDSCRDENGEYAGKLLPEDAVARDAIGELKVLYQEYMSDMDAFFKNAD